MKVLTFIIAIGMALSLAGCPGKNKADEQEKSAEEADGGTQPSDKTMEQLKSLGYVQ